MMDEGPRAEDIERFDHEDAHCPDCGAEIWDSADVCPKCFAYLGGNTIARPSSRDQFRRLCITLIAVVLIIAMLAWML
jgi:hypothetical protein